MGEETFGSAHFGARHLELRQCKWMKRRCSRSRSIRAMPISIPGPPDRMISAMYEGQVAATAAVEPALDAIARAVDDAAPALKARRPDCLCGRGTSGRIGVQDGAELTPTFDWPADRVVFLMREDRLRCSEARRRQKTAKDGGARAVAGGAEDRSRRRVIAIAASAATPYTVGALRAAGIAGRVTIRDRENPGRRCSSSATSHPGRRTGSEDRRFHAHEGRHAHKSC